MIWLLNLSATLDLLPIRRNQLKLRLVVTGARKRRKGVAELGCFLLFVCTLFKSDRQGLCKLLTFASISHLVIADYLTYLDGYTYYPTAALSLSVGIAFVINRRKFNAFEKELCSILFAGISINAFGLSLYHNGFGPVVYDFLMGVIYLLLIARIMIRTKKDGRSDTAGDWRDSFIFANNGGYVQRNKEEAVKA